MTQMKTAILLLISIFNMPNAFAWGPISHRMLTETAALLVEQSKPEGWGPLISRHRFEMGYYSLAPDSVYRHKDGNLGKTEAPTHFLDLDIALGTLDLSKEFDQKLMAIPTQYKKAIEHFEKTIGKENAHLTGTAPWRVEQFLNLAKDSLKDVKTVQGDYQQGKKSTGDAQKIFKALYYLGILSHYTGDATMPYHVTSDWNGWSNGQGGIHFYFEFDCINVLEPGLSSEVLTESVKNQKTWLKSWGAPKATPVSLLFQLFRDDADSLKKLIKIDKDQVIIKPSDLATKTNAIRKPPKEICRLFRPMLIERLAKAAVLTAHIWEMALPDKVDFSKSSTLQFSDIDGDPDYIPPNY